MHALIFGSRLIDWMISNDNIVPAMVMLWVSIILFFMDWADQPVLKIYGVSHLETSDGCRRIVVYNRSKKPIKFTAKLEYVDDTIWYNIPAHLQIILAPFPYTKSIIMPKEEAHVDVFTLDRNSIYLKLGNAVYTNTGQVKGNLVGQVKSNLVEIDKKPYTICIGVFPTLLSGGIGDSRYFRISKDLDGQDTFKVLPDSENKLTLHALCWYLRWIATISIAFVACLMWGSIAVVVSLIYLLWHFYMKEKESLGW